MDATEAIHQRMNKPNVGLSTSAGNLYQALRVAHDEDLRMHYAARHGGTQPPDGMARDLIIINIMNVAYPNVPFLELEEKYGSVNASVQEVSWDESEEGVDEDPDIDSVGGLSAWYDKVLKEKEDHDLAFQHMRTWFDRLGGSDEIWLEWMGTEIGDDSQYEMPEDEGSYLDRQDVRILNINKGVFSFNFGMTDVRGVITETLEQYSALMDDMAKEDSDDLEMTFIQVRKADKEGRLNVKVSASGAPSAIAKFLVSATRMI